MPDETLPTVNDDLLEAVSHGIDNEGALPDGSNQLEDPADDTTPDAAESGGDDSKGDAGEQPTDESTEAAADDLARPRNADGTYKSKEQIAAEAAAKPGEAAKPNADPNAGKKPADAINDPIPKDLKQATQDRIRTLIDTTKQATERATVVERDFNQIVEGIKSTGTSPEQYGEMLSFMGMFNSQDTQQQAKALELANDFVVRLSTMLGVNVPSHDPMERHADLQQAVQTGKITKEYAAEIARTRNQTGFRGELTQQQQQRQQQEQQHEQITSQARSGLDQLQATLRANDPSYEAKKAILVPMLKPIFANLHPSQWTQAFQNAYQNLAYTAPSSRGNSIPKNQPMRAGKGSGGGAGGNGMNKSANSALDAMSDALARIGK